jgi:hypothetical protein
VYDAKIKIKTEKKILSLANIQKNVKVTVKSSCYSANKSSTKDALHHILITTSALYAAENNPVVW